MAVKIGSRNTANETALKGSVRVTQSQAREHPEWLSDVGNISWDLTVQKLLTFASGPAGSVQLIKVSVLLSIIDKYIATVLVVPSQESREIE
jgi:hypothetical protein